MPLYLRAGINPAPTRYGAGGSRLSPAFPGFRRGRLPPPQRGMTNFFDYDNDDDIGYNNDYDYDSESSVDLPES